MGSFARWKRFLSAVGIEDEFLSEHTQQQRTIILSVFAGSCRRNQHGTRNQQLLTGKTVKATVTHVRSTFRSHFRPDPSLDADGKPSIYLQRQLRGYTDANPMPNQQRALPLSVFRRLYHNRTTPLDEALGQLANGAFFFGLRSCEYLATKGCKRKTKRLRLQNIRFFQQNRELSKNTPTLLRTADTVSITFEFQKNRQKNITVTQPCSNKEICPVLIWAEIVVRILQYKGTTENTYVNTVFVGKQRYYVKTTDMFNHLAATVDVMQDSLGFDGSRVGTH